ncbi:4-hydroxybenzoate octaprenyltransferase [Candidatus Phycosocius bacilliformis]|uniref:4-hydroxybenzoate polyprenyltransferase n=2 Tax=Candidatus Phycosocius bacilliformis TaxID=1445552 RepID=A0A2P2E924_9PROT|nr:4-hydroxybenzoate octaprenyltransferase [Candidatus Phycosocius bacilliformis]
MGQFLGRAGIGFSLYDLLLMGLWIVGSIAMRGAGCSFNDWVDRDIDAQVERTAGRPLPAGLISPRQALAWTLAQCFIGLLVLLALPAPAQIVALCAIPMVAAYPFMKRITWWPQLWLGLTFNWGVLVGYVAVMGSLDPAALALYGACVAWTIGYDTLYAQQDMEDDALVGVKSTARLFGDQARRWVGRFYLAAFGLVGLACILAEQALAARIVGLAGGLAFGLHLWGQVRQIPATGPAEDPLGLFKSNKIAGLILVAGLLVQAGIGWLLSMRGLA